MPKKIPEGFPKVDKIKDFSKFLLENVYNINGIKLRDGTILIGSITQLFKDDDGIIWLEFVGTAPAGDTNSLTTLLKEGLVHPEALKVDMIIPLPDIHFFFIAFTTQEIFMEEMERMMREDIKNNPELQERWNFYHPNDKITTSKSKKKDKKVIDLKPNKVETQVKKEKISKEKISKEKIDKNKLN